MRPKIDERAEQCTEYYRALIHALRHVAYRCGYALGVHGSLKRDIDLLACPWRDGAMNAEYLVEELRKAAEVIVGHAKFGEGEQPTQKPHGRLAWSMYLSHRSDMAYLDISVMPRLVRKD